MTRRTDIVAGVLFGIFAIYAIFWLIPERTSPPQSEFSLPPAFMPSVSAAILLVTAILLVLAARIDKTPDDGEHEEFGADARGIGSRELKDVLYWSVFSVLAIMGLMTIGFILTGILMLIGLMLYAEVASWRVIIATSITIPVVLQQIAWHAFTVQMPEWRLF